MCKEKDHDLRFNVIKVKAVLIGVVNRITDNIRISYKIQRVKGKSVFRVN